MLDALEETWPSASLTFCVEMNDETGRLERERLPDRARWIADRLRSGKNAQVFSGLAQPAINVNFDPSPQIARDGTNAARVTVWLPQDALQGGRLRQILGQLGDAGAAWHGTYMPQSSGSLIFQLIALSPPQGDAASLLEAMPELSALKWFDLYKPPATARLPNNVGWLNYWSEATATLLNFLPEHAAGGAERTPAGAWSWQLTAEPFDVWQPEHAAALLAAYGRFAAVAPDASLDT